MELFFSVSDQDAIFEIYLISRLKFYFSHNLSQKLLGNIVLLKTVMKPGRFQNMFII